MRKTKNDKLNTTYALMRSLKETYEVDLAGEDENSNNEDEEDEEWEK